MRKSVSQYTEMCEEKRKYNVYCGLNGTPGVIHMRSLKAAVQNMKYHVLSAVLIMCVGWRLFDERENSKVEAAEAEAIVAKPSKAEKWRENTRKSGSSAENNEISAIEEMKKQWNMKRRRKRRRNVEEKWQWNEGEISMKCVCHLNVYESRPGWKWLQ